MYFWLINIDTKILNLRSAEMISNSTNLHRLIKTFYNLRSPIHNRISLMGIFILFTFLIQIISGVMLAFSLNCDPMNIPISRNEEDMEDLYADDFFWLHERGVDYSFVFIYLHIFRKLHIGGYTTKQEGAWKSGSLLLLFLHVVTFFGLVLCCTHLSEVTLTIAANMLHSAVLKYGKIYWWVFPNQELNFDTVIRLMYGHYTTAFLLVFGAVYHSLEMHYDWKDLVFDESNTNSSSWFDDVLKNELSAFSLACLTISSNSIFLYTLSEPSSTELFMWGDVGSVSEIRFYGVTPHWYFRGFMAWLIACPHHYLGLGGLIFFMAVFYFQPQIKKLSETALNFILSTESLVLVTLAICFYMSVLYGASYLPYGKFFNRLGGNEATLISFSYAIIYLATPLLFFMNYVNLYFFKKIQ